MKKIVYLHGFSSAGSTGTATNLRNHLYADYGVTVVSPDIPVSPAEAVPFIKKRGEVFYEAFQKHPSAMGAIIGIPEEQVLDVIKRVGDEDGESLYIANYNGPGQVVISGSRKSVRVACKAFMKEGAKKAVPLCIFST